MKRFITIFVGALLSFVLCFSALQVFASEDSSKVRLLNADVDITSSGGNTFDLGYIDPSIMSTPERMLMGSYSADGVITFSLDFYLANVKEVYTDNLTHLETHVNCSWSFQTLVTSGVDMTMNYSPLCTLIFTDGSTHSVTITPSASIGVPDNVTGFVATRNHSHTFDVSTLPAGKYLERIRWSFLFGGRTDGPVYGDIYMTPRFFLDDNYAIVNQQGAIVNQLDGIQSGIDDINDKLSGDAVVNDAIGNASSVENDNNIIVNDFMNDIGYDNALSALDDGLAEVGVVPTELVSSFLLVGGFLSSTLLDSSSLLKWAVYAVIYGGVIFILLNLSSQIINRKKGKDE